MDKQELIEIIEQAARKTNNALDLGKNGITELPSEIGKLTNLQTLSFHDNQLTQIPDAILKLTNLQALYLDRNQLTQIPDTIAKLTNLKTLYLHRNQLTQIPDAIEKLTNLQTLYLHDNQLTRIPDAIEKLTNLQTLTLGGNPLTQIPDAIEKLTNLLTLNLGGNPLTQIPDAIEKLTNLQWLYLDWNRLTQIPDSIAKLTNLQMLSLGGNQLTQIPDAIAKLTNLQALYLDRNQLTQIPDAIAKLKNLEALDLYGNQLTELPTSLVQLKKLESIKLEGNPLTSPPPEIVEQGTQAILAYLREEQELSQQQWVSKMLIVGEGGVGKTALLRSLRSEPFDSELPTTHGINIKTLNLEHPTEAGVTMNLNSWDFGGQEIYHATHQFFLTSRSLFMLVWNARHGYEQGKLYYWLDTIKARAPESPVVLVATWIDERDADLPLRDLKEKYPQIVGQCEISNKTGQGIEELQQVLASTAADLPLMGESWPTRWLTAAEAVRSKEENHINPQKLWKIMDQHGVSGENPGILGQWLHELGDILYFQDDEELSDLVILKPQWVTGYISDVLESEEVIGRLGIFTREHMNMLWGELTPSMRDHFLRLMERFDLSYRTLENREISLVVERLPFDPPDYEQKWDAARIAQPFREMSMRFKLNTIPAGIPTWFIARSHRFTTRTHWRNGALFTDTEKKHLALVEAYPHDRFVQLTVRGPSPYNFFTLLKDGLELTLQRFPGLKIDRMIPCPGHDGELCDHEFSYAHLQKAIEKDPPVQEIQCPASFEQVSVPSLLFGLHWRAQDAVLERINDLAKTFDKGKEEILSEVGELRALAQREFINIYRREQSKIESHCPNVFVLRTRKSLPLMRAIGVSKLDLQLYCQAPGEWHPTAEGGRYKIDRPVGWLKKAAPYIHKMVAVLKYVAPLAGPWVAWAQPTYETMIKNDIGLMAELVKKLPEIEEDRASGLAEAIGDTEDRTSGAALRALRQLLDEKDPDKNWGGLRKVLTPEGHYMWLCEHHAKQYE